MAATRRSSRREGGAGLPAILVFVSSLAALPVGADEPLAQGALFPRPLHLTREVGDSLSGTSATIEEYCHGNRIVSIRGARTAIADYGERTLTIIDFDAGTYSVSGFEALAAAREALAPQRKEAAQAQWRFEPRGARPVGARWGDAVEAEQRDGETVHSLRVTADREIRLSRAAVEALVGSGHPARRDAVTDAALEALRPRTGKGIVATAAGEELPLPLEQTVRIEVAGETIETRSAVVRIGSELPPPERLAIPAGARLVEAREIAAHRLMQELDGRTATRR